MESVLTQFVGYAATVVGTVLMLPQVYKSYRSKSVSDVSWGMVVLYMLNCLLWLAYGLLIAAVPLAITNLLALLISIAQGVLKWRYGAVAVGPARSQHPPIKAVIYDMDGLIIDSEPLWREAEIRAFKEVGIVLTEDMCRETMGLRVDEVIEHWLHRFPDARGADTKQLERDIWDAVIALVKEKGRPLPGVRESVEYFRSKGLTLALASTSAMVLIDTVLDKFGMRDAFAVLHSAEFEPFGKPHPGVYITTAQKLGIAPQHCLALEDSVNGVLAAKAGKMRVVAVPEADMHADPRYAIADAKITSLTDIAHAWDALA